MKSFGESVWHQIEELLDFNGNEILVHNIYSDNLFSKIIDALITIRQMGDHDFYMEFFGINF